MRKKPHYSGGRNNNNNNKRRFTRKGGGGGGGRFGGGGDDADNVNPRMRKQAQANREKYLALGKDALSAGDRVESEYYLQHADHYLRILNAIDAQFAQRNPTPERSEGDVSENTGESTAENAENTESSDAAPEENSGGAQLAAVLPAAKTVSQ